MFFPSHLINHPPFPHPPFASMVWHVLLLVSSSSPSLVFVWCSWEPVGAVTPTCVMVGERSLQVDALILGLSLLLVLKHTKDKEQDYYLY